MLKIIDSLDTINRSEVTYMPNMQDTSNSNTQNAFYKKKIFAGGLALYLSILPISNTITQTNEDIYTENIKLQYADDSNNSRQRNMGFMNTFVFNGNNYQDGEMLDDNLEDSNYNVINLSQLSYTNPGVNLEESFKDVNNMITERKSYKNVKNKVVRSYRTKNIIEDLGYYEENEVQELEAVPRKKVKIQGKVISVKRTAGLLV